jgi:peptide/nickel transport system permease protein
MPKRQRIGLLLLGALVAIGLLGPLVVADPNRQSLSASLSAVGGSYLLGADHFGRSILARLVHGLRLSLGLSFVTVSLAAGVGAGLGMLAAWWRGWVDRVLVVVSDAILALPGLLFTIMLIAFAPGHMLPLFLGLAIALWVEFFRVTRATTAALLAEPYVEALRLLGMDGRYIARHVVWPALRPILTTLFAFGMATSILTVATLSFAGIGMRPPTAEWGSMTAELVPYYDEAPLAVLLPAIAIFVAVLAFQLVAAREREAP